MTRMTDTGARELATRWARAVRAAGPPASPELRDIVVVIPEWGQIQRAADGTTFVEAVIQIPAPQPPTPVAA